MLRRRPKAGAPTKLEREGASLRDSKLAFDVDELAAEGDRPAGSVRRDRPRPAGAVLDVGDQVAVPAVDDEVAGLQLVSVNGRHRLAPFRAWVMIISFVS